MKAITKRLRTLRAHGGLSQLDTALRSSIKEYRYWRIENGYTEPTDVEITALARTLKCAESDIVPTPQQVAS